MSFSDITRESVIRVIDEFDHKGKEEFLNEYGFQDAKRYYLLHKGKRYPSKAVVGVAHRYACPELGPLTPDMFSGGKDTVQRKLESLGFQIFVSDLEDQSTLTFERGQVYRRNEIHDKIGGQQYGGISTPKNSNYILLFTGEMGKEFGYADGWTEEGLFLYTGEGQVGDMQFSKGNLAIRDHIKNGKDLLVFAYVKPGFVRFVDQMLYTGHRFETRPDKNGVDRQAIIFELTPESQFEASEEVEDNEKGIEQLSMDQLRKRALSTATTGSTPKERKSYIYQRSAAIKLYALRRADGVCEGCNQPAPFMTADGKPYLEVHHIRKIADGGPDHPEWVVAVCPNCHRKAHYSNNCKEFNEMLRNMALQKETLIEKTVV